MFRTALLIALTGMIGCGQKPAAEAQLVANPLANVAIAPATPESAAPVPAIVTALAIAPEPRMALAPPSDLGGHLVANAVTIRVPTLPTVELETGWQPRQAPLTIRVPDALAKAALTLPPVLPVAHLDVKPTAPRERVPIDLGGTIDILRPQTTFPIQAGITQRARDAKVPPPLPVLGRQFTERVSLEDPTVALSHAAITSPPVKVLVAAAPFQRVTLPNPFELGEQVRPVVPKTTEPGLAPVLVDPRRVK